MCYRYAHHARARSICERNFCMDYSKHCLRYVVSTCKSIIDAIELFQERSKVSQSSVVAVKP